MVRVNGVQRHVVQARLKSSVIESVVLGRCTELREMINSMILNYLEIHQRFVTSSLKVSHELEDFRSTPVKDVKGKKLCCKAEHVLTSILCTSSYDI
jgi:hypothetical protein